MNEIWYNDEISVKAINRFFKKSIENAGEVHCIQIYQHGELKLRIAQDPYRFDDKREVYSLSKSFTSTAVGIASDKGLLDVSERIVDIFPDKCPEQISENLKKMTIKHLLTMNTGHSGCVMNKMREADDSVQAFLSQDVKYEPGTHFVYNTGATCLLGAIVEKRTGMSLFDFANENILKPLSIKNSYWNQIKDGTAEGGIGIHISCDDALKFGIMYLNKGVYDGKRIVSEQWVNDATSEQTSNGDGEDVDWHVGYGYQIWMNSKGGYRGDGAFGQFCLVIPQRDMVVATFSKYHNMANGMNNIFELIETLYDNDDKEELMPLGFPTFGKSPRTEYSFMNRAIALKDNPFGFTRAFIEYEGEDLAVRFSDGRTEQTLLCGNGEYIRSECIAKYMTPKLLGLMNSDVEEIVRSAACYKTVENGIEICSRVLICPNSQKIKIYSQNGKMKLDFLGDNIGILMRTEARTLEEV